MKLRQRLERLREHSAFPAALHIIETLKGVGAQAVFAGGGVRDALLGVVPKDLDIATSAEPEAVEKLFARTLAVGKAFGTVVVIEDGHSFEVTTFRKEGPYHDGRRPSHVSFTDLEQDARRRDFTINALYYDPVIEMIDDHVGGLDDLRGRRLRTVGRADERFHEDRLRMLRAVRFVAQLGFNLDPEALQAIRRLGAELRGVSAERILAEVRRLLEGAYLSEGLKALQLSGLAEFFWPEISTLPLKALKSFAAFNRWENAFAALMWLSGNDGACEVRLSAWKAARDSQRVVREQIEALEVLRDPASRRADRAHALGGDVFADVLVLAGGVFENEGQAARLDAWVKEYLEVADADGRLPPPLISGQDLIANGVPPGPAMGEILKRLYDLQLEGGIRSKAEALERINK